MNDVLAILENLTVLTFVKLMLVVGLVVYAFFAFLFMRQIGLMNRALQTNEETLVRILGIAHFILAIFVLFIAFVVL